MTEHEEEHRIEEFNYWTSLAAIFPFTGTTVAFIIIVCRRRLADSFLKWSAGVLVVGMAFRVAMFIITVSVYKYAVTSDESYHGLQLEIQVFYFTMPYYLFLMVAISLFFSAHSSYKDLRNSVFPQLRANDGILRPIPLSRFGIKLTTRRRYICLLAFMVTLLLTEAFLIIFRSLQS